MATSKPCAEYGEWQTVGQSTNKQSVTAMDGECRMASAVGATPTLTLPDQHFASLSLLATPKAWCLLWKQSSTHVCHWPAQHPRLAIALLAPYTLSTSSVQCPHHSSSGHTVNVSHFITNAGNCRSFREQARCSCARKSVQEPLTNHVH